MIGMNNVKKIILYVLEHEVIENGYKCKPLSMSKMLNILNKVYGTPNIPHNKITEKLGIPTRKVIYIMLECQTEMRMY